MLRLLKLDSVRKSPLQLLLLGVCVVMVVAAAVRASAPVGAALVGTLSEDRYSMTSILLSKHILDL